MADDDDTAQLLFPEKTDAFAFPVYPAQPVERTSEVYRQNVGDWADVLKEYQDGLEWCASQGTKHYEERHKRRGLLLGITWGDVVPNSSPRSSASTSRPRYSIPRIGFLCRI